MPQDRSQPASVLPALLALGTAISFWITTPVFLRYLARDLDAWTVNGMRYLFAILFWLPYVVRHYKRIPPGRNIWKDALKPASVHVVGQTFFAVTFYFNDATIVNFVSRSGLVFASIFGFALLPEERPLAKSVFFWSGFIITFSGIVTMYWGGLDAANTSGLGMTLLLIAFACWGLYAVFVRKHMHGYSVRQAYGVISLYAGPIIIINMLIFGDWSRLLDLTGMQWLILWASAVTGLALGHVLFFFSIHRLGPITSEGSLMVLPFLTALLASRTLGERMDTLQWIGGLVLVSGCALLLVAKFRLLRRGHMDDDEDAVLPSPR